MARRKKAAATVASIESQQAETEKLEVVSAAKALAKLRWKGSTAEQRQEAARIASAGRMVKISPKKRREIAHAAASSISPEAARARAQKAAETRRRNAELRNAG
jgi:hypothetical protein